MQRADAPPPPGRVIPPEAIYLRDSAGQTLQAKLMGGIVEIILSSRAAVGMRMPGSRELARSLGISRMTVTLVYQELTARGYLHSRPRSGHVVAATAPSRRLGSAPEAQAPRAGGAGGSGVDWDRWLGDLPRRQRVIRKPQGWRDYPYPFIYGQADPQFFDHAAWRDCARRALGGREFGRLAVDMIDRDDPMLVDHICSHTLPRRGIHARPEEVLITVGSQNALYITLNLLARPGRLAVLEEPGYPDFAETLRRLDAPVAFVPVDDEGMDPAQVPQGAGLVVITPSHHAPTGTTMPMARRTQLLARAAAQDFLIVEDDYDFEMSYLAPPLPALKSLDTEGRVIYLGSFSKSLFPGLRIGYLVADGAFIALAREARAIMLRHQSPHLQRITAYFLSQGHYDAHVVRLRHEMRRRRAELMDALQKTPFRRAGTDRQGGASLWLAAPDGIDSATLADRARARGVLIEPGAVFFDRPPEPCPYFRLGYGSITVPQIGPGLTELTAALQAG